MKTLYFECNMGAAGDMLMAALLELHGAPDDFLKRLNSIGIPGVSVSAKPSVKCGITGTHVKVQVNGCEEVSQDHPEHTHADEHAHSHNGHHGHSHGHSHDNGHSHESENQCGHANACHNHGSYQNIRHLISHLDVSDAVKRNALGVYNLIAEAESHAHGVSVEQIHFHEVGEMDAVADIIGVCMLIEELAFDKILSSPINVGSGHVRCSHGILPVPAPATADILRGVPIYSDQVKGELCTPTGAAILKHFVNEFCPMPTLTVSGIGYGMGKKDFERANCVRAFIGIADGICEKVSELVCNLDDMTPEAIAFAQQLLLDEGALDVYTTPIGMKKGRSALSFTCMCRLSDKDKMLALIFKHTTTLGVRQYESRRYSLQKEHLEIQTKFGPVRIKTSYGFGVKKSKPEYEDIARIAREAGLSMSDVLKEIMPASLKHSHKFFSNSACEYFPCHKVQAEEGLVYAGQFNCLFCFCPLYAAGDKCGGKFEYDEKGTKSCINCEMPHKPDGYDMIISKMKELRTDK